MVEKNKTFYYYHYYYLRLVSQQYFVLYLQHTTFLESQPLEDEHIKNDWIGPPDKVSNIRSVKFHKPQDETQLERNYREQRETVQQWHHEFWENHNKSFFSVGYAIYFQLVSALNIRSYQSCHLTTYTFSNKIN